MNRNASTMRVPLKNRSLSMILSALLSSALVLIPVLPIQPAHAGADGRNVKSPEVAPARSAPLSPALAAPLAPSLTATKVDSFADPDGDNKAEPGDTITYTVTITNNGTDATNVVFNDTIDPNTTLVPGSVQTQPIAANDSYNVLGNIRIQPNAASGLLANDCDPDNGGTCSSAGLSASGPSSSAQGGDVTVNADGSFSYNPPAGFEGADSFTYTVTDASGHNDTATATFTVNEMVWFVDNTAAPGGDGRLTNPFNSLAPLNGAGDPDESFDVIYVLQGAGAYGGGIVLEDNQRLAGQGTSLDAALAVYGITVPPHSDARPAATGAPTLANAGGDVITLANSNHVSYINASAVAPASSAISSNAAGGSTVVDNVGASASGAANGVGLLNHAGALSVTNSSVSSNSTGTAVLANGGSTGITFTSTTVSQNVGRVVDIQNRTGGAVSFNGSSTVTGTNGLTDAVVLLNNTGGSAVIFNAAVQLNTNAAGARGLVADSTGSFNLVMAGGGSAVSSTGGAAVDIEDINVNIQIATTFSTGSNANGVRVNNVTGSASFGNTAVNTSTGTGVLLTNNAASITFTDLDIAPAAGQRALHATDNSGVITSASGTVATTTAVAVEITSASGSTPLNVQLTSVSANGGANGILLTNTTSSGSPGGFNVNGDGTSARNGTGGTITATTDDGVRLDNAAGVTLRSMNLTNNGDTVSALLATNESALGEHAVEAVDGSNITLSGVLVQNPAASGLLGLNLTGTNRINLDSLFTDIDNAQTHGVFLSNSGVNLTLFEINDSDFTNSDTGASMVFITNGGTANMTVEVENGCVFEALNNQAVTLSAGATVSTTGTLTSTVNGNIFRNAAGTAENNVGALVNNGATHNSTIEANLFDNVAENGGIANTSIIRTQNSGGKMTAVVKGNTVQNISYAVAGRHVIGH
ncbi:MAG TPA: Ig-like domain-containing protein, partial [Pyrinomonadaceae bacterium]|nr:Ig-like domain-containing protein [Pyrinomonadaceae bacterium]